MAEKPAANQPMQDKSGSPKSLEKATAGTPLPAAAHDAEPLGIKAFQACDGNRETPAGQMSGGVSPGSAAMGIFDWGFHLASAPGKRMELARNGAGKWHRFFAWPLSTAMDPGAPPAIEPLPGDRRFAGPAWTKPSFSWMAQTLLLRQQWLHNLTHVPGVTQHHEDGVFTSPGVIARTRATGGMNVVKGWQNRLEDQSRRLSGRPLAGAADFAPGRDVAVTPGKVVFRNHLIGLIQYAPATEKVQPEPVLIVPAWIMKGYILGLGPEHALIRWLVAQGHTVFALSWRNSDASDRSLELGDCRRLGVMAALDAIGGIAPGRKVHGVGCCLRGTLLSLAAAAMAGVGDDRPASLTLLAAQVDFTGPGELALVIDPSQLHFLESMMWNRGYLKIRQFTDCEVIFALTPGGHNAGIVGPRGHPRRSHRIATRRHGAPPPTGRWRIPRSRDPGGKHGSNGSRPWSGAAGKLPAMGQALCDASGPCVFQR